MRYKKINEATVQCIISEEDMEEYGLTLADIFERNEKGEGFLRDVVERAHDEIGYQISGDNIAMQITPMRDEGLIITFSDEGPAAFQHMLEHIKEVLTGLDPESVKAAIQGQMRKQGKAIEETKERAQQDMNDSHRMLIFASMNCLLRYCAGIPSGVSVKSKLYKLEDAYYLCIEKNRISKKNFNKLSAQAVEFGTLAAVSEEKLSYLEEHGECLIEEKALTKLRKACL